jgi:hypothetical protein
MNADEADIRSHLCVLWTKLECEISMENLSGPQVGKKRRRLFCEHCKSFLSKSTYYRHRANYFDRRTKVWVSEREVVQLSSSRSDSDSSIQLEDDHDAILYHEAESESEQRKSMRRGR